MYIIDTLLFPDGIPSQALYTRLALVRVCPYGGFLVQRNLVIDLSALPDASMTTRNRIVKEFW